MKFKPLLFFSMLQHKLPASHELVWIIPIASITCCLLWLPVAIAAVICGRVVTTKPFTNLNNTEEINTKLSLMLQKGLHVGYLMCVFTSSHRTQMGSSIHSKIVPSINVCY